MARKKAGCTGTRDQVSVEKQIQVSPPNTNHSGDWRIDFDLGELRLSQVEFFNKFIEQDFLDSISADLPVIQNSAATSLGNFFEEKNSHRRE